MELETLQDKKRETLRRLNQESNQMTRECIQTALLELMAAETFDHITVTSIIQRAGVSKGGFYRNYKSKEEVLQKICEELFQYLSEFLSEHKIYENTKEWYTYFFETIANHADAYRMLVKAQAPKSVVLQFDEEKLLRKLQRDDSVLERYRALAIAKALAEVALVWFRKGMPETPSEMAEIMMEIFLIRTEKENE